jgi:hypothetical protein
MKMVRLSYHVHECVKEAYDNVTGEGYNDYYVASDGSFVVRIKAHEAIAKGDLLQSNGPGTAKEQSDDQC